MKKKFTIVHPKNEGGGCYSGSCPTIYKTNTGTYILQGKKLSDTEKSALNLPLDEDAVEVPFEFLETFIESRINEL